MDAIELLRADHLRVLDMLDALERGPLVEDYADADQMHERRDRVTELIIAESRHEAVEEQYFWPMVRKRVPDGDRLADAAVEQEQAAKHVLDRLAHVAADQPEFQRLISQIVEDGRRHIAYEEETVWPAVRTALSQAELAELGDRMATAKKSAPTRPHPHTPPRPAVLKTAGAAAAVVDKLRDAASHRGR